MGSSEKARWECLYGSHADQVFAYAIRRVGLDEAPDVVSETFLTAWRRIGDVPADALPWLYSVARNVIANSRRAERRREALQTRLANAGAGDPNHDPIPEVDARADIVAAMQLLPETEREALMLIAWEDLDIRRAATAVGCAPGTFAVRVHRARRHLRKILTSGAMVGAGVRSPLPAGK